MKYYAITINNKELTNKFRTIKSVYQYYSYLPIGDVIIIAVERNELNKNIHYHVLIKSDVPITSINEITTWYKELETDLDVLKYYNYCKKDGNYKIYNNLGITEEEKTNTVYIEMLELVKSYDKLEILINDNPHMIKYLHRLKMLWKLYKRKEF